MKLMGNFNLPDEHRTFPRVEVEFLDLPTVTVSRTTFQPGWTWYADMKPPGTNKSCQVHHIFVLLSGHFTIILDDGTEINMSPGDVADIPPGHDARVIGDKPAVLIDFSAKKSKKAVGLPN